MNSAGRRERVRRGLYTSGIDENVTSSGIPPTGRRAGRRGCRSNRPRCTAPPSPLSSNECLSSASLFRWTRDQRRRRRCKTARALIQARWCLRACLGALDQSIRDAARAHVWSDPRHRCHPTLSQFRPRSNDAPPHSHSSSAVVRTAHSILLHARTALAHPFDATHG